MTQTCPIEQLYCDYKVRDFMRWDYLAFAISGLLLFLSVVVISVKGFNYGVDFTGGTMIEVTMEKPVNTDKIRELLQQTDVAGIKASLQNLGRYHDIIVRMPLAYKASDSQNLANKIINIIKKLTKQKVTVKRIAFIGPNVSANLVYKSVTTLLVALVSILVYIRLRFGWYLAIGIVIALVHDIMITAGALSLFHIEIDLSIVASLMSVIGYSLNDSIVVSDRIRENFNKIYCGSSYKIFNISLTQTLHRTLITSGTILVVILILYFFGGHILEGFALTMLIGVPIGTVSSIYIASALALKLGMKNNKFSLKEKDKEIDEY